MCLYSGKEPLTKMKHTKKMLSTVVIVVTIYSTLMTQGDFTYASLNHASALNGTFMQCKKKCLRPDRVL